MSRRPGTIHYDDMLRTAVMQPRETAVMRALGWQQLVDILARRGGDLAETADVSRAYELLDQWRDDVAPAQRHRSASMVAAMSRDARISPRLYAHFLTDDPTLAAPVISSAAIDENDLVALIPRMSPAARALLRNRTDLGHRTRTILQSFGPTDMALTDEAQVVSVSAGVTPISELVDRIAQYRDRQEDLRAHKPGPQAIQVDRFEFETGRTCTISWTDVAWRGPLIGMPLAEPGVSHFGGVDAGTASAFRRRTSVVNARLLVAGDTPVAGHWRIEAEPYFGSKDGRFRGYRGRAQRLNQDMGEGRDTGLHHDRSHESGIRNESFRQLVHELKTPLNAIIGFSELIDQQLFGPVNGAYRERARTIKHDGERLLHAVEDVDEGARLEMSSYQGTLQSFDLKLSLRKIIDDLAPYIESRNVRFVVAISEGEITGFGRKELFERALSRLITALLGVSKPDETLKLVATSRNGQTTIAIDTPQALAIKTGNDDAFKDLDRTGLQEGPLLGLEFTLKLVRSLIVSAGGAINHDYRRFVLQLDAQGNSQEHMSESR